MSKASETRKRRVEFERRARVLGELMSYAELAKIMRALLLYRTTIETLDQWRSSQTYLLPDSREECRAVWELAMLVQHASAVREATDDEIEEDE